MNEVRLGMMVQVQASPGRGPELEARLVGTLPAIEAEEGTIAWLAVRLEEEPSRYLIVDVFPDESAREAHLEAGRPRLAGAGELLAGPPSLTATTVVAAKLPRAGARAANNERTVRAFYEVALRRRDMAAARKLMAPRYVQHDPLIADGLAGFEAFLRTISATFPGLDFDIKRIVADDDHVVVHLHGRREPGEPGAAIVDIFRLEQGLIAEHWCVRQPVTPGALHTNGIF